MGVLFNHVVPPSDMPWLSTLHERGWIGVDLFFVISAFLFFTLFPLEYAKTGRVDIRGFFVRRFLRLYPLMVGAPLFFMLVTYPDLDMGAAWSQLMGIALFADNLQGLEIFRRGIPYAGHLWTLSFEFQIYLVLPFIFYACVKLRRRYAFWLLAALWALGCGLRAYAALIPAPHPVIYHLPVLRPDSILLGMALALVAPHVRGGNGSAGVVLMVGLVLFVEMPNVNVIGVSTIFLYPVTAAICGALLWFALNCRWLNAVLSSKALVYLGKRSFGLYVFHLFAKALVLAHILPRLPWLAASPAASYYATLLMTLLLAILMASFSYRYVEKPFLLLKEKRATILTRPI